MVGGWLGGWFAAMQGEDATRAGEFFWVVVIATTAGLAASFTRARELEGIGASKFGVLFIFLLVAVIGNEIAISLRSGHKLSPADAVRLINDREPVIVDVRSQSDYRKGHIIGAINLPMARIAEADKELAKHKSKPMLLYCAIGTAAGSAREKLMKQGWEEVFPLRGGLNARQGAGLPASNARSPIL